MKSFTEYLAAGVSVKPLTDLFKINFSSDDPNKFNPWAKATAKDQNVNKQLLSDLNGMKAFMEPLPSNAAWFRRMEKEGRGQ